MSRDLMLILGILVVFPIFFVGLWLFVVTILSAVGGWAALAGRYPALAEPSGEAYRNSSGSLWRAPLPVNYNYILLVHVGDDGIGLATHWPFRHRHPPLLIPWQAIAECRRFSFLFMSGADLRLHDPRLRITIGGRAGAAILERCAAMRRS
jgi:hypothetical protein